IRTSFSRRIQLALPNIYCSMRLEKINLGETGNSFSPIFLDYIKGDEKLAPFFEHLPNIPSFEKAIKSNKISQDGRILQTEVIAEQYQVLEEKKAVRSNIEALKQ